MRVWLRLPVFVAAVAAIAAIAIVVGACGNGVGVGAGSAAGSASRATAAGSASPAAVSVRPVDGLQPLGPTEEARVVRIVDGDTIIIDRGQGRERLRYIGINSPESIKPDTPVEFMAKEASAANAALVEGATVQLESDVSDRDRFDRLLRYVWLRAGDGWIFVNLELVRQGYAQVSTFPPDVRWRDVFRDAQRGARDSGLGLWGPATPAP